MREEIASIFGLGFSLSLSLSLFFFSYLDESEAHEGDVGLGGLRGRFGRHVARLERGMREEPLF